MRYPKTAGYGNGKKLPAEDRQYTNIMICVRVFLRAKLCLAEKDFFLFPAIFYQEVKINAQLINS